MTESTGTPDEQRLPAPPYPPPPTPSPESPQWNDRGPWVGGPQTGGPPPPGWAPPAGPPPPGWAPPAGPWQPPPSGAGRTSGLAIAGWVSAVVVVIAIIAAAVVLLVNRPDADRQGFPPPESTRWSTGEPTRGREPTPGDESTPGGGPRGGQVTCGSGTVAAAGLPALGTAMNDWAAEFRRLCPGASVTFQGSGVGAGAQGFIAGVVDVVVTDGPMDTGNRISAMGRCGTSPLLQLPVAVRPVGVAYNLPVPQPLTFRAETLALIFSGAVTKWNDAAIAADNRGVTLPDSPITVIRRAEASTTTEVFTSFLAARAPSVWKDVPDAQWPAMYPVGIAVQGGGQAATTIRQTLGGIGYGDWADLAAARVRTARVVNAAGDSTALNGQSATLGLPAPPAGFEEGLAVDYGQALPGGYPIVSVLHLAVCAERNPVIGAFLTYVLSRQGQVVLDGLGLAPLPEETRIAARSAAARVA